MTDNVDVGLTATVTGTVNTAVLGAYTLTYNVTDTAGNAATPVTRTVNVTDQAAPVITLVGLSPVTVAQGSVYVDAGSNVTDNVDVGLTATVTGTVNTAVLGAYTLTYNVTDAAGNTATPVTRAVNVHAPPIANAGLDQFINQIGIPVTLDGSASSNPNGGSLTYSWQLTFTPLGSTATLLNATTVTPSFTPDIAGQYTLRLDVSDGIYTRTDYMVINVNHIPVANAGMDQIAAVGQNVVLYGNSSSDADYIDTLTYQWSLINKPIGSAATLINSTNPVPTLTLDMAGAYDVQLVVNDGKINSNIDIMRITTGQIKWQYNTGSGIWTTPAVGLDGNIYLTTGGLLHSITPTGVSNWTYAYSNHNLVIDSANVVYLRGAAVDPYGTLIWSGPFWNSSPALDVYGTLYASSGNTVVARNSVDGTLKWTSFSGFSQMKGSPVIGADGTIYVSNNDDYLYAINSTDGSKKWGSLLRIILSNGGVSLLNGPPSIGADGTIYVTTSYSLHAINPNGGIKWSIQPGFVFHSSPAIAADGTIYVLKSVRGLVAYNPDGTEKWTISSPEVATANGETPAIGSDGTIYFVSRDSLIAVNPDGTLKWKFATQFRTNTNVTIGADGTIYLSSGDFNLYAINDGLTGPQVGAAWPMYLHDAQNTGSMQ